jgi:hypothetical protein
MEGSLLRRCRLSSSTAIIAGRAKANDEVGRMVATLIGGAIVTEATRTYFKTKEEAQAIADKCNEEKGDPTYIYEVWHGQRGYYIVGSWKGYSRT